MLYTIFQNPILYFIVCFTNPASYKYCMHSTNELSVVICSCIRIRTLSKRTKISCAAVTPCNCLFFFDIAKIQIKFDISKFSKNFFLLIWKPMLYTWIYTPMRLWNYISAQLNLINFVNISSLSYLFYYFMAHTLR